MEKGIDAYIKEQFDIGEVDIRTYSPLTFAYIGDGIYDLIIRSIVVGRGNTRVNDRKTPSPSHGDGEGYLQAGEKCQVFYYGKKCHCVGLQKGHGV